MIDPLAEGGWIHVPFTRSVARDPALVKQERESIKSQYKMALLLQPFFYAIVFLLSPEYVLPFTRFSQAYPWILAVLCFEALLIWAHWKLAPISNSNRFACYLYSVVFGMGPAYLIPLLGPAIVTVTNSLCTGYPGAGYCR